MIIIKKRTIILINFAIICFIVTLYLFRDIILYIAPECIISKYTGLWCVSCGATRAFVAMLNFDLLHAVRQNALFVILGLVLVFTWILYNINVVYYNKASFSGGWMLSSKVIIIFCVMAGAFFIMRNIPCFPFELLAPT